MEHEAEIEFDMVIEGFYILHKGGDIGRRIGDVLQDVEDWFEANARRKGRHLSAFSRTWRRIKSFVMSLQSNSTRIL